MAFKTGNRGRDIPERVLAPLLQDVGIARVSAQALKTANDAGTMTSDDAFAFVQQLSKLKSDLATAASKPGVAAEAKRMFDSATYDLAAEFTALTTDVDSLCTWFEANFPTSSDGRLKVVSFVGDGSAAVSGYTIPNTPALSTRLQALIDQIEP